METKQTQAVIIIRGGVLQEVYATREMEYYLIDYDVPRDGITAACVPNAVDDDLAALVKQLDAAAAKKLRQLMGETKTTFVRPLMVPQVVAEETAYVAMILYEHFAVPVSKLMQQGTRGALETLHSWAAKYYQEQAAAKNYDSDLLDEDQLIEWGTGMLQELRGE